MEKAVLVTKNYLKRYSFDYTKVKSVLEYDNVRCILVDALLPDYSMILDSVELIISKTGSRLSHLAICANEKKVTILRVEEAFYDSLPANGNITLDPSSLTLSAKKRQGSQKYQ